MIDLFLVFHRGGAVLWSHQENEIEGDPIGSLVKNVLLEEKKGENLTSYKDYTMKWTFENKLGLVFVACYMKLTQIFFIDDLLENVKKEFCAIYNSSISSLKPKRHFRKFDGKYEQILSKLEEKKFERRKQPRKFEDTKKAKNVGDLQAKKSRKKKKKDTKSGESKESGDSDSDDAGHNAVKDCLDTEIVKKESSESEKENNEEMFDDQKIDKSILEKLSKRQVGRKPRGFVPKKSNKKNKNSPNIKKPGWKTVDETDENVVLDHSKKEEGKFEDLSMKKKEYGMEANTVPSEIYQSDSELDDNEDKEETKSTGIFSFFSNLASGKALNSETLDPVLSQIKNHLVMKNVASEIAEKLCQSVKVTLEGQTVGTFSSVKSKVKETMEEALTRIMTPKKSTDVLQAIAKAKEEGRPYSIVFVGVNGVGKSTSLAKLCAYFLAKGLKVGIAACDTFRSGAVEQLRTHASCLKVPLFERGYNKDASSVAMDGIKNAKQLNLDVILVDTAGRMQDNEPLMRALSKLINVNKPDLVLFVGEALVGNDAVDQLSKFNKALINLSSTNSRQRPIDGIILTKFDTIDDKVGAAISMTYTTGQPIMFVGCGQQYRDLKRMNVKLLINALLK